MNAERLLAHYTRVADAPDAIAKLRRFILDLAMRGKLVQQDANDEPASELLKRIAIEKAQLLKTGTTKKPKAPQDVRSLDSPIGVINTGWTWVRLGDASTLITKGSTPTTYGHIYTANGVKFVKVETIRNGLLLPENVTSFISEDTNRALARSQLEDGDILFSIAGSIGTCAVVTEPVLPANTNQALAIIRGTRSVFLSAFLLKALQSSVASSVLEKARGGAMNNVSLEDVRNFAVPLPPLAEQHRIVAKVDELMGLCDRLEAARAGREAVRDRLAAASLAGLNKSDPHAFPEDLRFALGVLPALTTRPDQIKALRQTILNLAVRGKLVSQDQNDEPAPDFDRSVLDDLEPPFEIPATWRWARLQKVGKLKGGGTPSRARDDFWTGAIPWVSPKDMKIDYIAEAQMSISEMALAGSAANLIETGSVLFVVRGMILAHSFPVAISRAPLAINQDMKALTLKRPEMAEYLLRALKALKPEMLRRVQRSSHGTCRLEGSDYSDFLIPIPPIAEQDRIVAKVDELMRLCNRLEASLTVSGATRSRLLDALLAEALVSVPLKEAA
jgi:type I restriction enzyme S subunit